MGDYKHISIIVTCVDDDDRLIEVIWQQANIIFDGYVTRIKKSRLQFTSFLIVPDGSKIGHSISLAWETKREIFYSYIRQLNQHDKIDMVEIAYGGSDETTTIVRTSYD